MNHSFRTGGFGEAASGQVHFAEISTPILEKVIQFVYYKVMKPADLIRSLGESRWQLMAGATAGKSCVFALTVDLVGPLLPHCPARTIVKCLSGCASFP